MADKREKGVKTALRKVYRKNQLGEEVELSELDAKTYKSYSKLSSKEADKSINRFLKGGNEKELTHAEKRSKGINSAQQLMARKKMTVEEVELNEMMTRKHFQQVADVIKEHPSAEKRSELAHHHASIFKASNPRFDHDRFFKAANAERNQAKHTTPVVKREKGTSISDHMDAEMKLHKEEVTMEYNEETGHIALVNAIIDGNRDEANEIFDAVLSGRINPIVSAKKEELAKTMFTAHEEVTEEYEPLPLTEEAEHGHHHRVHASLTDRKNDLSNEAHNAFMSGNVTKEHKKEVLKHVKSAEGRLDLAKAKLGSAESADHLNAAAVHITDGGLHLQNVRTYTSLGFRGY
jgi:hypothetical protein